MKNNAINNLKSGKKLSPLGKQSGGGDQLWDSLNIHPKAERLLLNSGSLHTCTLMECTGNIMLTYDIPPPGSEAQIIYILLNCAVYIFCLI